MELKSRCHDKVIQILDKGVEIPSPLTLDIGDEVRVDRISGDGVKIYPGCRIYGEDTVISAGVQLGSEGPVTVDNCQLGPGVELKGGYFKGSVFLEESGMGLGAHVREGCILEEQANGAHCVGLKQTILFPFVTLGSLINFCDCLMAGGTSRKDHSEVGSSYIHFNFTPDGDKTTASLIGDVPRGVMLNRPPIFLGGQGGIVGPVVIGYGNVVAAGTIVRQDYKEENKIIWGKSHGAGLKDFQPRQPSGLKRILRNNILYIANLLALRQWYIHGRGALLGGDFFSTEFLKGAISTLELAIDERRKRVLALVEKCEATQVGGREGHRKKDEEQMRPDDARGLKNRWAYVDRVFTGGIDASTGISERDHFLERLSEASSDDTARSFTQTIKTLDDDAIRTGTEWLKSIVDTIVEAATGELP